jgi:glycosyltransferase involved in cell wall biosynthesis
MCGRAVVATDVGGTSEVIVDESTGVLVPERRPDELRVAIERLLDDPELRERIGAAARVDTQERFDWHGSAAEFARIAKGKSH